MLTSGWKRGVWGFLSFLLVGCAAAGEIGDASLVEADLRLASGVDGASATWNDVVLQRVSGGYALGDMLFESADVSEKFDISSRDAAARVQWRDAAGSAFGTDFESGVEVGSHVFGGGGSAQDIGSQNSAASQELHTRLWSQGVVPFAIAPGLPNKERVRAAIRHWRANTNLRFVERTTEPDYLVFQTSDGCYSYVGRIGGAQPVFLADGCTAASVMHEIGHAVGLIHEHQRPDRDDYIRVRWKNIEDENKIWFQKHYNSRARSRYDVDSIMHYFSVAFGKPDGNGWYKPSIVRLDGSLIPYSERLSVRDARGIDRMYEQEYARR